MEIPTTQPLVSIGLGVYKGIDYIEKSLKSLVEQSYQNIELIISDNGSTDGSTEICKKYAQSDSRISYYRQDANIERENFKFMLSKGTGKYFMWAADDDMWHKDFVGNLVNALEAHPEAVSAMSYVMWIDETEKQIEKYGIRGINYSGKSQFVRLSKLIKVFEDSMTYGLFKREAIKDVYFPRWKGVNKNDPINSAYPVLSYILTKGDFVLVGTEAMWYNRIKDVENHTHHRPFNNSYIKYLYAVVNRKYDLILESIHFILKAGGDKQLIAKLMPFFVTYWFFKPIFFEFLVQTNRLLKGRTRFF